MSSPVLKSSSSRGSGDTAQKTIPVSKAVSTAANQAAKPSISWTGFTKTSNLVLFLLTAGVFAVFCAFSFIIFFLRLKPSPPGEDFWFKDGLMYLGMQVHLWSVLPAGMLLPLQFLPVMRRRYITLHIWSGRLLFVMLFMGNITAGAIAKHSFGGTIDTQMAVIALISLTSFSTYKAWSSIRNLYIDQHRVWAIRTWSYACSILSLRIFMIITTIAATRFSPNGYRSTTTCEELAHMYGQVSNTTSVQSLYTRYPACAGYDKASMGDVYVVVDATLHGYFPEQNAALLDLVFGVSGWAAVLVHVLLVEVYLNYTKDEDERLRKVSVIRRKAAGLS